MINISDGSFRFENFTLSSRLRLNEFIKQIPEDNIISKEVGEYTNLYLRPQKSGELYFVLRLFFHKGTDLLDFFYMVPQIDDSLPSWSNWSREKEQEVNRRNILWLQDEIGNPPYEYDWGKIQTAFHEKEGSSYITIYLTERQGDRETEGRFFCPDRFEEK